MKSLMIDDADEKGVLEDVRIHVIGPNMIQNELLISFLENNLGAQCSQYRVLDSNFKVTLNLNSKHFLLIDCLGDKQADPWQLYRLDEFATAKQCFIIFYNINTDSGIESKAVKAGVHGLFFQEESYKALPKAITTILGGELWFSRKIMSRCIKKGSYSSQKVSTDEAYCLTDREKEILVRIAAGTGNKQIADDLCISLNTVKCHIYNIYRKINVQNRFQASLWAARYV